MGKKRKPKNKTNSRKTRDTSQSLKHSMDKKITNHEYIMNIYNMLVKGITNSEAVLLIVEKTREDLSDDTLKLVNPLCETISNDLKYFKEKIRLLKSNIDKFNEKDIITGIELLDQTQQLNTIYTSAIQPNTIELVQIINKQ